MQISETGLAMIRFVLPRTDDFVLYIRYLSEQGKITERTIVPISLFEQGGCLRLRAICVSSEGIRTFRTSRILNVKIRIAADVLVGSEKVKRLILSSKAKR